MKCYNFFFILILILGIISAPLFNQKKNKKTIVDDLSDEGFPSLQNPLHSIKNLSSKSNNINTAQSKSHSNQSVQVKTNNKTNKTNKKSEELIDGVDLEKTKQVFKYGTYGQQVKILNDISKHCQNFQDKKVNQEKISQFRKKTITLLSNHFEKPFNNDIKILVGLAQLIGDCELMSQLSLLENILLNDRKFDKYPKKMKEKLQQRAWLSVIELVDKLDDIQKKNFGKLNMRFFRNAKGKLRSTILSAAQKLLPKRFNRQLIFLYKKEKDFDNKINIITTIASYKDTGDINFFKNIIENRNEEKSKTTGWVALVALTNYSDTIASNRVKKMVIKYANSEEVAIVARAYYVLSFFDVGKEFFFEGIKNNNDLIRLEAVKGLKRFPLDDIEELLNYKIKNDYNNLVKKEAKKILEFKKKSLTNSTTTTTTNMNDIPH